MCSVQRYDSQGPKGTPLKNRVGLILIGGMMLTSLGACQSTSLRETVGSLTSIGGSSQYSNNDRRGLSFGSSRSAPRYQQPPQHYQRRPGEAPLYTGSVGATASLPTPVRPAANGVIVDHDLPVSSGFPQASNVYSPAVSAPRQISPSAQASQWNTNTYQAPITPDRAVVAQSQSGDCVNPNATPTGGYINWSYSGFGCSTQNNWEAMASNKSDLVRPRTSAPVSSERRAVTYENYIKGENTSADTGTEEPELSGVGG